MRRRISCSPSCNYSTNCRCSAPASHRAPSRYCQTCGSNIKKRKGFKTARCLGHPCTNYTSIETHAPSTNIHSARSLSRAYSTASVGSPTSTARNAYTTATSNTGPSSTPQCLVDAPPPPVPTTLATAGDPFSFAASARPL